MEISLKAEKLFQIGIFDVTNTMVASFIVTCALILIALLVKKTGYDLKSRFYQSVEIFIEWFNGIVEGTLGKGKIARQVFPVVATFFLFIIANNYFGLFPGVNSIGVYEPKHIVEAVHNESETAATGNGENSETVSENNHEDVPTGAAVDLNESNTEESTAPLESHEEKVFVPVLRSANSDINMTLAIAILSMIFVQYMGIRTLKVKEYLGKFFNFSNPINFFIGILELISETIKIFSFAFRLFGNTFAGDVLLLVVFGLVPYLIPGPFIAFELLAGFIQALVFAMLTLAFIKSAITSHHPPEHAAAH